MPSYQRGRRGVGLTGCLLVTCDNDPPVVGMNPSRSIRFSTEPRSVQRADACPLFNSR